jgi:hypothetical protein
VRKTVRLGYTPKAEALDPMCVTSPDGQTLCVVMPMKSDWPAEDDTVVATRPDIAA